MTGIKTASDALLRMALGACVAFSIGSLIVFFLNRMPPYGAGVCLGNDFGTVQIKIESNSVMHGISIVTVTARGITRRGLARFEELRNPMLKEVTCSSL